MNFFPFFSRNYSPVAICETHRWIKRVDKNEKPSSSTDYEGFQKDLYLEIVYWESQWMPNFTVSQYFLEWHTNAGWLFFCSSSRQRTEHKCHFEQPLFWREYYYIQPLTRSLNKFTSYSLAWYISLSLSFFQIVQLNMYFIIPKCKVPLFKYSRSL